ncbi:MAG: DEAD/DEAH box helicase [Pirellulaceae bacterium]
MAATITTGRGTTSFLEQITRLTYHQACQLLGTEGAKLLTEGSKRFGDDLDPEESVYLGGDLMRVRVPDAEVNGGKAIVVLTQISGKKRALHLTCDQCEGPCEHAGAALDLLLKERMMLGLAGPPDASVPLELLTREELIERALDDRRRRAEEERMTLRSLEKEAPWTDYVLTSHGSGQTYRLSVHGDEPGQMYCSCADFRTNRLGTCKHLIYALDNIRKRFKNADLEQPYEPQEIALYLDYQVPLGLRFRVPSGLDAKAKRIIGAASQETLPSAEDAVKRIGRLQKLGHDVLVYPDAEAFIERHLIQGRLAQVAAEIRENPGEHPLRTQLLRAELLPYQMDGIAFAVGAGRAILADDMGLGKTIQGIGVSELLAREAGIQRVLVVCPASLKSQWRDEIHRFGDRSVQLIIGRGEERERQYHEGAFFTVCNYEQVMRDLTSIESVPWDLIILDEGQRIKNWESKTSKVVRSLKSTFALVLSGTPLENRLDELYTVTQFVDQHRLGPAYQFFNRHRIVDDNGKVLGYRHMDEIREKLSPILLRRTRGQVMTQLPERTTTVVRIPPSAEQLELHMGFAQTIKRITNKKFLTEMDLLQLQKALLMCRMAADGTFLVDKLDPGYSTKLNRLTELLADLSEQEDRKIIIFSEWRRMLDRIEGVLDAQGTNFVRLDGQVPQKQRAAIVRKFQEDPECSVILMTNAGSTGLNLQSANTVINVDLPWNPAILEQRIARAHRMGQKNHVDVFLLVTEETLEERLLDTLAMKQDLALAALDINSDVTEVHLQSGMEELRRRLERLLGPQAEAPIDQSRQQQVEAEAESIRQRRERVASAGGQLVGSALQLVSELLTDRGQGDPDPQTVEQLQAGLAQCVERTEEGKPQLRITLDNDDALRQIAVTLSRLLVPGN